MNLYSNKQRWKIFLLIVASVIVGITLWYSNHIADGIRNEERQKVKLWSEAIKRRAELVNFTKVLFDELKTEERKKADMLANAYQIISDPTYESDLTFITQYLWTNTTIPVLFCDETGKVLDYVNLPEGRGEDKRFTDSLFAAIKSKGNDPIDLPEINQKIYYDDSRLFTQLQGTMDDLIHSFISETVINAASVPVLVVDSALTTVYQRGSIDSASISTPSLLRRKLAEMERVNEPIVLNLVGQEKQLIYFEDSAILKQLEMFPIVQLILVGVFLFVAYLIFSTFRKAEQNQVWVGMAKETAHQLGTPLSSLMAWSAYLEAEGVPSSVLLELNKDIDRLNTITDRFSKIGSVPELSLCNIEDVVRSAFDYLRPRLSNKVSLELIVDTTNKEVYLNQPLFGWVLENLLKNAVDAMEAEGKIVGRITSSENKLVIDITDTGKGIPKNRWKTVFQPGYTTKKRGWGLGLSLVKRIINEYHEGKIYISHSETGVGTTFRIELRQVQ
jgi:two-component system, sporulation sensor kinase D